MPLAVVTGANKGIGLSIVRALVQRYPQSGLARRYDQRPLLIYLTARSRERGEKAVQDIRASAFAAEGEAEAKGNESASAHIEFRELDVADEGSVRIFAESLEEEGGTGVDILVNNAGVALDGVDASTAAQTLQTNYFGTLRLTAALLPTLIPPHGRIVNMASMLGKLNKYPPTLTSAFRAAASPGIDAAAASSDPTSPATALMQSYLAAVEANTASSHGWPSSPYAISKTGVIAATLALAAHEKATRPRDARCINACCPGYVATDMTGGRGRKSVAQGAEMPVLLALGEIGGVSGEFWERGEVSVW